MRYFKYKDVMINLIEDVEGDFFEVFLKLFLKLDGDLKVLGSWEEFFWDEVEV